MKLIYKIIGLISLGLGILGAALPLLPTTPFLLLSLWCFSRSSDRLKEWLLTNKMFGEYLSNYTSGEGVPFKIKVYALTLLWVTIGYTSVFAISKLWVSIMLVVMAVCVTIHLVKIKTKKNEK